MVWVLPTIRVVPKIACISAGRGEMPTVVCRLPLELVRVRLAARAALAQEDKARTEECSHPLFGWQSVQRACVGGCGWLVGRAG